MNLFLASVALEVARPPVDGGLAQEVLASAEGAVHDDHPRCPAWGHSLP